MYAALRAASRRQWRLDNARASMDSYRHTNHYNDPPIASPNFRSDRRGSERYKFKTDPKTRSYRNVRTALLRYIRPDHVTCIGACQRPGQGGIDRLQPNAYMLSIGGCMNAFSNQGSWRYCVQPYLQLPTDKIQLISKYDTSTRSLKQNFWLYLHAR